MLKRILRSGPTTTNNGPAAVPATTSIANNSNISEKTRASKFRFTTIIKTSFLALYIPLTMISLFFSLFTTNKEEEFLDHLHNGSTAPSKSKEGYYHNHDLHHLRHPRIIGITFADASISNTNTNTDSRSQQPTKWRSTILSIQRHPSHANNNGNNKIANNNSTTTTIITIDAIPTDKATPIQKHWYQPNANDYLFSEGQDETNCEPMYDWVTTSYMNCNHFHELELRTMRMINKGGSRIAFEMKEYQDYLFSQSFVYKTIKYSGDVNAGKVEQQRKDALLMERASNSKFIPELYGYCSVGVMMDYMPEGNMHDYIKGSRLARSRQGQDGSGTSDSISSGKQALLPPVDRLRIAIHIATSVADLHGIEKGKTSMPPFFHNDICCHQYLFQNGLFKLNDFNYAKPILVKKHQQTTTAPAEICLRERVAMGMWKGRSLEEHQRSLKSTKAKPFSPDKLDVWMMGNVIYIILTDLYTFELPKRLSTSETSRELVAGKRSPYPEHIANSTDPSYVAMKTALDTMCWVEDWKARPSAQEVSDYLMDQLRKISGEEHPDLRVVLPERDKKQRPTDSEFNKMGY